MLTSEQVINLGFRKIPHFTVMDSHIYQLGRNRELSIGCVGTPNEMMFICEKDRDEPNKINDLI